MTNRISQQTIEAAMRQGRVERALAFRQMTRAVTLALRNTAKMIVGIFA